MKLNNKITPIIQFVLLVMSTLLWYWLYKCSPYLDRIHPDLLFVMPIPWVIVLYKLFRWLFNKYLWKYRFFSYFIDSHNVGWIWSGKWTSSYNDTSFDVRLEIIQTYSNIEIKSMFSKSVSHSTSAELIKEWNSYYLVYTYGNAPFAERVDWMNMHIWCIKLLYIKDWNSESLKGIYFTSPERKTRWEITVTKTLA